MTLKHKFKIEQECGFEYALKGLSLSFNADEEKMPERASKLSGKDSGHNKFLESMVVWIDMTAPLYFWKQFDTYRTGITKQSESTMHTVLKKPLTQGNFQCDIDEDYLGVLNEYVRTENFKKLINGLPDGFLQRRIVCTNYKTLRNIYKQRHNHKLDEWKDFCWYLIKHLEHPDYLTQ